MTNKALYLLFCAKTCDLYCVKSVYTAGVEWNSKENNKWIIE